VGPCEDTASVRAVPDLPDRLRRAVGALRPGDDLATTLAGLLATVGAGTRLTRLVLAVDGPQPRELATAPTRLAVVESHDRIAVLVREATITCAPVTDDPGDPAPVGRDIPTDLTRHAVPVVGDGRVLAVLVGEAAPGDEVGAIELAAADGMATLLVPLLLVRRQLADVRELDRLRSDFIARVSHELRTPLTIITGFAGTLGAHEETLATEQRHAMLDRIVTASIRLEHLIEEVLALASVDAGLAEPTPRMVPVRDLVDVAVHDRGGTGRVEVVGAPDQRVHTDPEIARVVLGALLENALEQGQQVRVVVETAGDRVRVAVEDDGPGVPPELGTRVFERFVRGDDRSPGMGLGLAIATRMAGMIDARLWFDEVPTGARFVAELPAGDPRHGGQSP
jgi:signal transduction histidine kinase